MRCFFLLVVLAVFTLSTDAWACSCFRPDTPKNEFDGAKAVFTAHVPEIIKSEQGYAVKIILKIDKVWKGKPDKNFIVVNPNEQCAYYHFKENKKYLVYAHSSWDKNKPDDYHVSGCSRTRPLDKAQLDIRYLDAIIANKDTRTIDKSLPAILISEDENDNVRTEALRLLDRMIVGNRADVLEGTHKDIPEGTVEALVKASESENVEFKTAVISNMSSMLLLGISSRADVKEASLRLLMEALLRLLTDDDQNVRNHATRALGLTARLKPSDVFKALVQELKEVKLKQWDDKKLYEKTLEDLGTSIARVANTEKEKIKAVEILYKMIDEISNPSGKASVIRQLGYQKELAVRAAPKLLKMLKTADDTSIINSTISALGNIKATGALEDIKSYLKHEDCWVVTQVIQSAHKIAPDKFPGFFRNKAMPEMKTRYESCDYQFDFALEALGPAAKDMKPFLVKRYKAMEEGAWRKDNLKSVIDKLQ